MTVAGSIVPSSRPETVREAVIIALGDLARGHKKSAEEADVPIYERVVRDYLPEAVIIGAQTCLEEERFHPSPAVFRKYAKEAHERIVRSRSAVVTRRADDEGMRACPTCGAVAVASASGKRLEMSHDPVRHGIYRGGVV